MLSRLHGGHMGIDRCKRHARDVTFRPGMSRDVEETGPALINAGAAYALSHGAFAGD